MKRAIPLALYIHFPWCIRKCPYCDFNSHPLTSALQEDHYIDRLLEDFSCDWQPVAGSSVKSIFLGGGTPSLFSANSIQRLLAAIRSSANLGKSTEITLEANPGTFEQAKFHGYLEAGVNRLSIGVQSFDDEKLSALGRVHSAEESVKAIQAARTAGFGNINLDLMHGLPGQSPDAALRDLQCAIEQQPDHISWYQLTLEPKTVFAVHPPVLPVAEQLLEIEARGLALLHQCGFQRYEVSAFTRPGKSCIHNLNYWHFGDYLGIGAGAHGKLTSHEHASVVRTSKPSQPRRYLKGSVSELKTQTLVPAHEVPVEFLMNALRLIEGVDEQLFWQRTGQPLAVLGTPLNRLRQLGLMRKHRLALTARGLRYLDSVVSEFLSP